MMPMLKLEVEFEVELERESESGGRYGMVWYGMVWYGGGLRLSLEGMAKWVGWVDMGQPGWVKLGQAG